MAILNGIKRISPLDLNKNVTIGVAFPLDDVNMFQGTQTIKEQVKTNLINVLLTVPGERINLPKYGIGLKKLLFENEIDSDLLREKINYQVNRYVEHINVTNIAIMVFYFYFFYQLLSLKNYNLLLQHFVLLQELLLQVFLLQ